MSTAVTCQRHPWCSGHGDLGSDDGSHARSVVVDHFDDGGPCRVVFILAEPTDEFPEPEQMTCYLDLPSDWSIPETSIDSEIDRQILALNRGRAVMRVFLASIGRIPELSDEETDSLAAAAGWTRAELVSASIPTTEVQP